MLRVQRGQALVEQTGLQARVYRLVSDKEQLVLTGDVQQISEQLARATIYLLADELVRFPVGEQPKRLAQLKEDKGFGFDLRLVTVSEADMDEDQSRRVSEGDTVMALGKGGVTRSGYLPGWSARQVLEIGPLYQMNPVSAALLVLIAVSRPEPDRADRLFAGAPARTALARS